MNQKKICYILLLCILVGYSGLFLSGCDSDNSVEQVSRKIYLPARIASSSNYTVTSYDYNSNHCLKSIETNNLDNGTFEYHYIFYDKRNRVERYIISDTQVNTLNPSADSGTNNQLMVEMTFEYRYDSILVTRTERMRGEKSYSIERLALDDHGLLKSSTGANGATTYYTYDSVENHIESWDPSGIRYTYKYDNRNGIFKDDRTPRWFQQLAGYTEQRWSNNRTSVKIDRPDSVKSMVSISAYNYDYNNDGYPTIIYKGSKHSPSEIFDVYYLEKMIYN